METVNSNSTHRLIVDVAASGPWNMAVDEALLVDAAASGTATLRFYQWSEPTLSLGYFQRHAGRHAHAPSRHCAMVRRQTGGGAILHDRELTYSIALPASHPLARESTRLYIAVHEEFIAALLPPAVAPKSTWLLRRCGEASNLQSNRESFLCFERRACGDVVAVAARSAAMTAPTVDCSAQNGVKILGSAQRRHRGAILQHGSLLLVKSPAAPELIGWSDLTGGKIAIPPLVDTLAARLANILNVELIRSGLPEGLELKARELANTKYGAADWTNRR